MGLIVKKAQLIKANNSKFVDFKHSFFFDCGAPVFKTEDGQYVFAPNLEAFKQCFANMTSEYLQTVNLQTFQDMFKDIKKHYNYPEKEAQAVLAECLAKINASRTKVESKTNNTITSVGL